MQHEPRNVRDREQQIGAERDDAAGHLDLRVLDVIPGGDLAGLVELAVERNVRLRRHAQHLAALDHHGRVVDPVAVAQGGTHQQDRGQGSGGTDDVLQGLLHGVQQRILQQQVLDRIARQGEFGEDDQPGAVPVLILGDPDHGRRVGHWIRDRRAQRARGHADEALRVDRAKVHAHAA